MSKHSLRFLRNEVIEQVTSEPLKGSAFDAIEIVWPNDYAKRNGSSRFKNSFRTARCHHQSDGRREGRKIATQQLRKDIGIAMACRALDVPRATYYRRLSDG